LQLSPARLELATSGFPTSVMRPTH